MGLREGRLSVSEWLEIAEESASSGEPGRALSAYLCVHDRHPNHQRARRGIREHLERNPTDGDLAGLTGLPDGPALEAASDLQTRLMERLPPTSRGPDADSSLRPVRFFGLLVRPIMDPDGEAELLRLRSALLALYRDGGFPPGALELVSRLARQGILTGNVRSIPEQDLEALDALAGTVEDLDRAGIALLLAFRDPEELGPSGKELLEARARELAEPATHPGFRALVEDAFLDPAEEARIAETIPELTTLPRQGVDPVRDHYETDPYPRWQHLPPQAAFAGSLELHLHSHLPHTRRMEIRIPTEPEILVAGCGTGRHPLLSVRRYGRCKILAVDLSKRSLAYAQRKADELGEDSVAFAAADIQELDGLDQRFDVVECGGVLHHLPDPVASWKTLSGLVRPGGLMLISLYSRRARREVNVARRLIEDQGLESGIDDLRAARAGIMSLPENHPARQVTSLGDFYNRAGVRDLLFHPRESQFELPEIEEACEDLGLEFLGFEFPADQLRQRIHDGFRRRFGLTASLRDLSLWSRFEAEEPDTFLNMYHFWLHRPA